jgi:hypothetical protein
MHIHRLIQWISIDKAIKLIMLGVLLTRSGMNHIKWY